MEELQFLVKPQAEDSYKIEAIKNETKVSWLYIPKIFMHYGRSSLTVGGIGGVFTPREHRGKGYSSSTIRYSLMWMKEKGYSILALFGIQEYYHRFKFAGFMGEHVVTISLRNASRIKSKEYEWEYSNDPSYKPREIARIYEELNSNKIARRVRNPDTWNGFRKGFSWQHSPKVLVINDNKEIIGYAAIERWPPPDEMIVAEINAKNHRRDVYRAIVKIIYDFAIHENKGIIKFYVPYNHPLVSTLLPYGIKVESEYLWSGGGMARIINLKKTLEEISEELSVRSSDLEGEISIITEEESVTLKVNKGNIRIIEGASSVNNIRINSGETAQMILGYRNPLEIISSVETHGEVGLLEKLFPMKTPYVWQPDRW
ncbi:MAG: GNAT family N-acetyltransferase [Thermoproteales archaeon]|nr:GNAT family N-acetyltransferase [Thermoproteales archaeon]